MYIYKNTSIHISLFIYIDGNLINFLNLKKLIYLTFIYFLPFFVELTTKMDIDIILLSNKSNNLKYKKTYL